MKVYKIPCALCGAHDPDTLFPAFYKKTVNKHENIVICKKCGLVYKYPVVPASEKIHYLEADHWVDPYFDERLSATAEKISKEVSLVGGTILDIGAAAGHLLHHMQKWYPSSRLIGIEPSANACADAVKRNPKLEMLNGTIETIDLPEKSVDLITIIGVDYLFLDHVAALTKIASLLKPSGNLYIERNVFLESKAYRSTSIDSIYSLFGMNSMMNNWFTERQMGLQLSKFFGVKKSDRYIANVVKGNKNIHACWLCGCKSSTEPVAIPNDYQNNIKYIRKLPKK